MSYLRTLEATASKEGKWWNITIDGIDQVTTTKRVGDVQEYADRLASSVLGISYERVKVNVSYVLPEGLSAEWEAARIDTRRARDITMRADERTKKVIRTLHDAGCSDRDIETMLGISFQQVAQVLKTT